MVLGSTQISNNKFAAFKFTEQPVGTELSFYFVGLSTRPGKGSDFTVLEVMAFDPEAKTNEELLSSVRFYSISAGQAQIDSFINGKLDKATQTRVTRPIMFPKNFYKLKYASPQGTKYVVKGVEKETTSIGFEVSAVSMDKGDDAMFERFLVTENIQDAIEHAHLARGVKAPAASQGEAADVPSNLPKL